MNIHSPKQEVGERGNILIKFERCRPTEKLMKSTVTHSRCCTKTISVIVVVVVTVILAAGVVLGVRSMKQPLPKTNSLPHSSDSSASIRQAAARLADKSRKEAEDRRNAEVVESLRAKKDQRKQAEEKRKADEALRERFRKKQKAQLEERDRKADEDRQKERAQKDKDTKAKAKAKCIEARAKREQKQYDETAVSRLPIP